MLLTDLTDTTSKLDFFFSFFFPSLTADNDLGRPYLSTTYPRKDIRHTAVP